MNMKTWLKSIGIIARIQSSFYHFSISSFVRGIECFDAFVIRFSGQ